MGMNNTEATNATTGLQGYRPEMGEARPTAQIEAQLSHYGKHYFLYSCVQLSVRAFDAICQKHAVSYEMLLN